MDKRTYEALSGRLSALELDIGENSTQTPSLALQLGLLQQKLDKLYKSNAEFATLQEILRAVKVPSKEAISDSLVSEAEKQETLLVKYPIITEAYNNLVELLYITLPTFTQDACDGLDFEKIRAKQNTLEQLSEVFHALVVKNMIVFEKYSSLLERETNFWMNVEKKLSTIGAKVKAQENKHALENKY